MKTKPAVKSIATLRAEYANAVEAFFAAAKAQAATDRLKVDPLAKERIAMQAAAAAVNYAEAAMARKLSIR